MNLQEIREYKELKSIDFFAKQVVEGFITGLHKSPYHGFSVEFAEYRLYNQGESIKHIDWRLFARTDKLFVKKYEEETNLRAHIVLDTSSSMAFPDPSGFNKLNFSIYSAAALIYLLMRQRDAVGLTLFDKEINFTTKAKLNEAHTRLLLSKLQQLSDNQKVLNKTTSVSQTLHTIAEMFPRRSLVIIFSDMFENNPIDKLLDALLHLKHNKHEVIFFHTFDSQKELNLNYDNKPYKFIDMETGEIIRLNPNLIRNTYKLKIENFFKQIKIRAGQAGIDFVEADINDDFVKVLIKYLLKRQKLF